MSRSILTYILPSNNRLVIGLFGLVGMLGVAVGPFVGKLVDRLVPWYAALVATFVLLIFQAVQTGAGGINISAVIIACFGLDVCRQMQQVSLTSSVFTLVHDNCVWFDSMRLTRISGQDIHRCSCTPQCSTDHLCKSFSSIQCTVLT